MNPNSFETVKRVLLNLLGQAEVAQKRKWVHVGFDGLPYRVVADLRNHETMYNMRCII